MIPSGFRSFLGTVIAVVVAFIVFKALLWIGGFLFLAGVLSP